MENGPLCTLCETYVAQPDEKFLLYYKKSKIYQWHKSVAAALLLKVKEKRL